MLIQVTPSVCVPDTQIVKMVTLSHEGKITTSISLRGQYEPIIVKGDWVKKIVAAKQVGAVYVTSTHYTLRS